jgi:hypothetical protein
MAVPSIPWAWLRLVVDLVPGAEVERLPEPQQCRFFHWRFPRLDLAPFEASAPAKLRLALRFAMASAPALSRTGS